MGITIDQRNKATEFWIQFFESQIILMKAIKGCNDLEIIKNSVSENINQLENLIGQFKDSLEDVEEHIICEIDNIIEVEFKKDK